MIYKLLSSLEWKKDLIGVRTKEMKESPQYKDANNVDIFPKNMGDFLISRFINAI